MEYLEAQWTVSVHILQFASTHQYYRTAKYGPNRITGDEDRSGYVFEPSWVPTNHNTDVPRSDLPGTEWSDWSADQKLNVNYLHHQWSDSDHTLQFDSTGEYFRTVEYELQRALQLRDILWKPSRFWKFVCVLSWLSMTQPTSEPSRSGFSSCLSSNGSISELRRSWMTSWRSWNTNKYPYFRSRWSRTPWEASKYDF